MTDYFPIWRIYNPCPFQMTEVLALFRSPAAPSPARAVQRLPVSSIRPNPAQPRRTFPEGSLRQLAESIRQHGLLSPLLVRSEGGGRYQLIAGERRLRALELLGRQWAEAVVLSGDDCDCALIALVENLQREDLHFLDVALACRSILDSHPITQERLAQSLSMSPSALANRLRLLKLSEAVQSALRRRGLTERHARALLSLRDEAAQLALIDEAADQRLSVSELEKRVARQAAPAKKRPRLTPILRDNRIVINALMDTVRQLKRIGVPVKSRVEEEEDGVRVIVTIPAIQKGLSQNPF